MYRCALIIDDDNTTNLVNKMIFQTTKKFENIIVKNDGFYALEYLKEYDSENFIIPDLILLDINMPIMNGWEFIKEFENLPEKVKNKTKVIMLSASANILDIKKAKSIPSINGFVNKPFSSKKLEEIIETYL